MRSETKRSDEQQSLTSRAFPVKHEQHSLSSPKGKEEQIATRLRRNEAAKWHLNATWAGNVPDFNYIPYIRSGRLTNWAKSNLIPRGRDLWPGKTPEVRDSRTSRRSAHAQNQVLQIWLVLVSIYWVYTAIQNRNVVGPGQGSRYFQRMTKGTPGDEVEQNRVRARLYNCRACVCKSNVKIRIAGSSCRPQLLLLQAVTNS